MMQKIGFITCVELGLCCIEEMHLAGIHFDLLLTLQDDQARDKSGRIFLDEFAMRTNTVLKKVRHVNDPEAIEAIKAADLDWLFIIGWSQIASVEVLASVRGGVLGMHPTLLPKGRGRAAIPWAILKGLKMTGVTLFALDEGVDSGPILDQEPVTLRVSESAATLYPRMADAHRCLIRRFCNNLSAGNVTFRQQDESDATFWPGRTPKNGEITADMTVKEVDRLVRATTKPYPGAFVEQGGKLVTVWDGEPRSVGRELGGDELLISCVDGEYIGITIQARENGE